MQQYVPLMFVIIISLVLVSLCFSIAALCYSWMKIKMTEIQEKLQ